MKKINFFNVFIFACGFVGVEVAAQQPEIQYLRENSKKGLNVFETSKQNDVEFTGLKLRLGGDFAFQFQGLSQENDGVGDNLVELGTNFNLPSANLNLEVQLADGVRVHLKTYLSSRHHPEAYVKGGYIQFDSLDLIAPGFLDGLMETTTLRVGMDEINYGDTHFRRSDNAGVIYNPFVGNYIMDAMTTEPFVEATMQKDGVFGVLGFTNGRATQSAIKGDDGFVVFGKLGYDNQMSSDLRLRFSGSFYSSSDEGTVDYLYGGDRAGSRYYNVIEGVNDDPNAFFGDSVRSDFLPRFNPGFAYLTAYQLNSFIKYQGLEFFGVFEVATNGNDDVGGSFTQLGGELLYRFGAEEKFYVGARLNSVSGETSDDAGDSDIERFNLGGGWFMTDNIVVKLEYVEQEYTGSGWEGRKFQGASFDGFVFEAGISF